MNGASVGGSEAQDPLSIGRTGQELEGTGTQPFEPVDLAFEEPVSRKDVFPEYTKSGFELAFGKYFSINSLFCLFFSRVRAERELRAPQHRLRREASWLSSPP